MLEYNYKRRRIQRNAVCADRNATERSRPLNTIVLDCRRNTP